MIKMKLENQTPTCVISHLKLIISQINLICRGLNVVNYNVLCLFLWASINYPNKYLPPTQKEVEGKKGVLTFSRRCWKFHVCLRSRTLDTHNQPLLFSHAPRLFCITLLGGKPHISTINAQKLPQSQEEFVYNSLERWEIVALKIHIFFLKSMLLSLQLSPFAARKASLTDIYL